METKDSISKQEFYNKIKRLITSRAESQAYDTGKKQVRKQFHQPLPHVFDKAIVCCFYKTSLQE